MLVVALRAARYGRKYSTQMMRKTKPFHFVTYDSQVYRLTEAAYIKFLEHGVKKGVAMMANAKYVGYIDAAASEDWRPEDYAEALETLAEEISERSK